jgi:Domain of unknown function (DUF3387)
MGRSVIQGSIAWAAAGPESHSAVEQTSNRLDGCLRHFCHRIVYRGLHFLRSLNRSFKAGRSTILPISLGEIKTRARRNVVQARSFSEMLEQSVHKYQNGAIEAAQVIEELIHLAKDMRTANARGDTLHLSEDKLAFYDALEVNDSAVRCSANRR